MENHAYKNATLRDLAVVEERLKGGLQTMSTEAYLARAQVNATLELAEAIRESRQNGEPNTP